MKKTLRDEHGNVIGEKTVIGVASSGELSREGAVVQKETRKGLDALIIPQPVAVGANAGQKNRREVQLRYTLVNGERFISLDDALKGLRAAGKTEAAALLAKGFGR